MWRSAAIGFLLASGLVQAQENKGPVACGELANAFGPFDYRSASEEDRRLVNGAHFTEQVETLKSGKTTNWPGGDIDYTLRAFPNHPRALLAMMNLSFKEKRLKPNSAHWPVECYFDRAERFRGDDAYVKLLFGIYLLKVGRNQEAITKLEAAEKLQSDDPNLYYNLGLAYFDLKNYDKALHYAHEAYALHFPLPGLREKLKRVGAWKDLPPPAAQSAPIASASTPAKSASTPVASSSEAGRTTTQSAPGAASSAPAEAQSAP
jgi:tetratricopeptide (TPR) repeat protein